MNALSDRTRNLLFWAPRILGILFALFISLFALDVFGEGYGFWETAWALLMHLVPTLIVLAAVAIGWHWTWAGGLLFIALGGAYIALTQGRVHWTALPFIAGPLLLTGLLFLLDWRPAGRDARGRAPG